jgi:nucleoside phosphorylase
MLDKHHNPLQQNSRDHNTYTLGHIGRHNVILACLPTGVIGTLSAARVANQMLQTFEGIRFGLMVGVGGGVPSKENYIRLGDVVISKSTGQSGGVIQHDFGKTVQDGQFKRTGSLNRPPGVLLTALANLQSKHIFMEISSSAQLPTKHHPGSTLEPFTEDTPDNFPQPNASMLASESTLSGGAVMVRTPPHVECRY